MAFHFEALQRATRSQQSDARLYYQVFDVLSLDGEDLTSRPLLERKQRLCELLRQADSLRLRYVAHVEGNGEAFFQAVDGLGLEGIVSKRARSVYHPGVRTADWVKVKCFRTHRFAIVGYTTENGLLASLALAGEHEGQLHYAGQVEWGVPRRDDSLLRALRAIPGPTTTIAVRPQSSRIEWVASHLWAEVRALAWQPGRALRHAVLRGVSLSP